MRAVLILLILGIIIMGAAAQEATPDPAPTTGGYRIVGYYTAWSVYGQQYLVTDIPADQLTHINYAFVNISAGGECILGDAWADTQYRYPGDPDGAAWYGNFRQLTLLKNRYPHLSLLLSIGGLTWSDKFTVVALTEASRQQFVLSCVDLMTLYGFDGLDVDWEFPVSGGLTEGRPEDKENFTLLLAEFRRQLDVQSVRDGRPYLLTIAAPALRDRYANLELDQIHPYLDWINLMGYGFGGRWSAITNHDSRLYASSGDPDRDAGRDIDSVVRDYQAAGVPADKIVLGVPFYGRGWANVSPENNGLYQPFDGFPQGTWGPVFIDYSDLQAHYFAHYTRYWDNEAQAAWLYNPNLRVMISYEDPLALYAKADYVQQYGLGGIMLWELAPDDDNHTLLRTIYTALNDEP